jgi:hypothetical protein
VVNRARKKSWKIRAFSGEATARVFAFCMRD